MAGEEGFWMEWPSVGHEGPNGVKRVPVWEREPWQQPWSSSSHGSSVAWGLKT